MTFLESVKVLKMYNCITIKYQHTAMLLPKHLNTGHYYNKSLFYWKLVTRGSTAGQTQTDWTNKSISGSFVSLQNCNNTLLGNSFKCLTCFLSFVDHQFHLKSHISSYYWVVLTITKAGFWS